MHALLELLAVGLATLSPPSALVPVAAAPLAALGPVQKTVGDDIPAPLPVPTPAPADEEQGSGEEPAPAPAEGVQEEPAPAPSEGVQEEPAPAPSEGAQEGPAPAPSEGVQEEPAPAPSEGAQEGPAPAPSEGVQEEPAPAPSEGAQEGPAPAPSEGVQEEPAPAPGEGAQEGPAPAPSEGVQEEPAPAPGEGAQEGPAPAPSEGVQEEPAPAPSEGAQEGPAPAPSEGVQEEPAPAPAPAPSDGAQEGPAPAPVQQDTPETGTEPLPAPVEGPGQETGEPAAEELAGDEQPVAGPVGEAGPEPGQESAGGEPPETGEPTLVDPPEDAAPAAEAEGQATEPALGEEAGDAQLAPQAADGAAGAEGPEELETGDPALEEEPANAGQSGSELALEPDGGAEAESGPTPEPLLEDTPPGAAEAEPAGPELATGPQVEVELAPPAELPTETPAELARLVPANRMVFAQWASLSAVEGWFEDFGELADGLAFAGSVDEFLARVEAGGLDPALIDRHLPVAAAVSFPPGLPTPQLTLILPVSDPQTFLTGWRPQGDDQGVVVSGNYVGFSDVPGYALREEAEPFATMPVDPFAARVDLAGLIRAFRPTIDAGMEQADFLARQAVLANPTPGVDVAPALEVAWDLADDFLDSADELHVALTKEGTWMRAEVDLSVLEDSPMARFSGEGAAALDELLSRVDPRAPLAFAFHADFATLIEQVSPLVEGLLEVYPEPLRQMAEESWAQYEALAPQIGPGLAASVDIGPNGLVVAACMDSADPGALRQGYAELLGAWPAASPLQIDGEIEELELGGLSASRARFAFDLGQVAAMSGLPPESIPPEQMAMANAALRPFLGPDGLQLAVGAGEGRVAMSLCGSDPEVTRAFGRLSAPESALPPELSRVSARLAGSSTAFLYRLDVGGLVGRVATAAGAAAMLPPGAAEMPTPFVAYGGIDGRVWRGGLTFDAPALARWILVMQGL